MGNNSLALKWFEPDNSTERFIPLDSSIVEIAFQFTNCFAQFKKKPQSNLHLNTEAPLTLMNAAFCSREQIHEK